MSRDLAFEHVYTTRYALCYGRDNECIFMIYHGNGSENEINKKDSRPIIIVLIHIETSYSHSFLIPGCSYMTWQ
jgi:hypothetical protein